ncbi:MAG TPA: MFS transporter, partial [Candidatus Eisenbacteria bacterium]|nr:MFS transporter [Candidatus Eisenbacteria bacterium]
MSEQPTAPPAASSYPTRWKALVVLALAQVVLTLDNTVVNVALPQIATDLGFDQAGLAWVVNAYALAFGGLLLLGGRLADFVGRRRLFVLGMTIFAVASLLAGLAWTPALLVAMRFLQGAAAAMVAPSALSLISLMFVDKSERSRALGVWGGLAGIGGVLGVIIGGLLTEFAGWRWVFLINVPVAIVAVVLAPRYVPESRRPREGGLDYVGAALITGGVGLAVYALLAKGAASWGDPVFLGQMAVAAVLLVAFAVRQRLVADPLIPLEVFRSRNRVTAASVSVLVAAALGAFFFSLTLYMQLVLDWSPLQAGLAYIPFALGVMTGIAVLTSLVPRIGVRRILPFGLAFAAAGMWWLSHIPVQGSYTSDILPGMLALGLGVSTGFIGSTIAGVDGATDEYAGVASAVVNASTQIGSALGLATIVAFATDVTLDQLAAGAAPDAAAVEGYQVAFLAASAALALAAAIGAGFL